MRVDVHHHIELSREVSARFDRLSHKMDLTLERLNVMATQAQLDKLKNDIAALIQAAVDEIAAAVTAAQQASPDPAIDALDEQVTATTQKLTDAAAALRLPPAA